MKSMLHSSLTPASNCKCDFAGLCARTADCLSSNKATVQISDELSGSLAVDDDINTHSCTDDAAPFPWWAVDLGEDYTVTGVTVTLPNVRGIARELNYYHLSTFKRHLKLNLV